MKPANTSDTRPSVTISGPGASACGFAAISILNRSRAYKATLSSSPDNTAEIGVGPSAWASGSQACSGASPTLVTVAEHQEHEGDVEQFRAEVLRLLDQGGPHHGVVPLADHRARRHVDQDRPEQRQRDADAAEDEVLPRR